MDECNKTKRRNEIKCFFLLYALLIGKLIINVCFLLFIKREPKCDTLENVKLCLCSI